MSTVSSDSVAQDQIKAFIERIERLEEERKAIAGDIAEVYAEAKGNGFDRKALKAVVRIRAQDHASRMEHEALVELYLSALGIASAPDDEDEPEVSITRAPAPARAHVEIIEEIPAAVLSAQPNGEEPRTPAVAAAVGGTADNSNRLHGADGAENEVEVALVAASSAHPSSSHAEISASSSLAGAEGEADRQPIPEPVTFEPSDPQRSGSATRKDAGAPAQEPVDRTKPHPFCKDPEDCGVEASWSYLCEGCKRAAASEGARSTLQ